MKKQRNRSAPAGARESRSRRDSRLLAREKGGRKNEGKHFELEKRLRKGGGQQRQKQSEPRRFPGKTGMERGRGADEKGRAEYDSSEGSAFSWRVPGFVATWKMERTGKEADHQAGAAPGGAADWQDFEDYEPGYSGHQPRRWPGGGFFSRENIERKTGTRALNWPRQTPAGMIAPHKSAGKVEEAGSARERTANRSHTQNPKMGKHTDTTNQTKHYGKH